MLPLLPLLLLPSLQAAHTPYDVHDIWEGATSSSPGSLTLFGSRLCFAAADETHGRELWCTDDAGSAPTLVKDIRSGADGSNPQYLIAMGDRLYFSADDGSTGQELWSSDGTGQGTVILKDICPGSTGSNLLKTALVVNGVLFFVANDGTHDNELWRTDGSAEGTVMVKDINPDSGVGNPNGFIAVASGLWFSANDGVHGYELWRSDGTENGTAMVKDIHDGVDSTGPSGMIQIAANCSAGGGSCVVFRIDDGVHGHELWGSDGTAEGTSLIKDVNPGAADGAMGDPVAGLKHGRNSPLIFFSADDGQHGTELWSSDGTSQGTSLVQDLQHGGESSVVVRRGIAALWEHSDFDTLVFASGKQTANEVYALTAAADSSGGFHIHMLAALDSAAQAVEVFGSHVYAMSEKKLWSLDGKEEALLLLPCSTENKPTMLRSGGLGLRHLADQLLFPGSDESHGAELWSLQVGDSLEGCHAKQEVMPGVQMPPKDHTGLVVGLVLGGLCLVGLAVAGWLLYKKKTGGADSDGVRLQTHDASTVPPPSEPPPGPPPVSVEK